MLTLHSFEMPNALLSVLIRVDSCSLGRRRKKSRQIRQISSLMWISNLHENFFIFLLTNSDQLSACSRRCSPIYIVSPVYLSSVSGYVFLHFSVKKAFLTGIQLWCTTSGSSVQIVHFKSLQGYHQVILIIF